MAEEVHNPEVELPRAITLSVPIGAIFGLFFLLPIVFTLPDVPALLAGESTNHCLNSGGLNQLFSNYWTANCADVRTCDGL